MPRRWPPRRRALPLGAGRWRLPFAGVAVTVLVALVSCAHTANDDDIPTLHMDARAEEGAPEPPPSCTAEEQIERNKGAVPAGAVTIVRMTVKADRAVPFWMFERAVQERAAWFCCDGVSVTRAVAEPGETLFHEIEATGWRKAAPARGE